MSSILCLTALNKIDEASTMITQMIEQYPQTADLLIIRARLYFKDKTKVNSFHRSYSFLDFIFTQNLRGKNRLKFFNGLFNHLNNLQNTRHGLSRDLTSHRWDQT